MSPAPFTAVLRVRRAMDAKMAARGLAYPWWIPAVSIVGEIGVTIVSLVQRNALLPPQPVAATLVLVLVAHALLFVTPTWVGWWADGTLVMAAVIWLLANPLHVSGPADSAPSLMMILAAVVIARDGLVPGLAITGVSVGVLVAAGVMADLSSPWLYALEVLFGLAIGFMIRWQMRALTAERQARAGERSRATLAERDRIAREIHDLVAHSLSVTLLHLAGARHALSDGDVTEALDALDDAERIGRQAMADIRRTVGAMTQDPSSTRPLPTVADIDTLVADLRVAGLDIRYVVSGDPSRLPAGPGLGLYRITQEALSNVARHAPDAPVTISLDRTRRGTRLTVRNPLTSRNANGFGRPRPDGGGAGVPGMTARATALGGTIRVGPQDDQWVVDVRLPAVVSEGTCILGLVDRSAR